MKLKFFLVLGFLFFLSSCTKAPVKWTKDYYDYQFGVIINGIEYHEIYKDRIGFYMYNRDSVSFIHWDGYNSSFGDSPSGDHRKHKFGFVFEFVIDSISFNPSTKYTITRIIDNNWFEKYYSDPSLYHGEFPVSGAVFNFNQPGVDVDWYKLSSVDIIFGEFDNRGYNNDTITFEFEAVNEKGDTLHMTDGYVKKYYIK